MPGDPAFGDIRRCECNPPDFTAGFPSAFRAASFADYPEGSHQMWDAVLHCAGMATGHLTAGLLYGKRGVGKTHLAYATLYEWRLRHWQTDDRWGSAWLVPDFLAYLRSQIDAETGPGLDALIQIYSSGQYLLVLDDLAAEKETEWGREQLFRILDGRYRNESPTLITSNAPGGLKTLDPRITDRFRAVTIVCQGETRRGAPPEPSP